MYNSDLFNNAREALESCLGMRQAFTVLPQDTEVRVILDNRISATLICKSGSLILEPREASNFELELSLNSESIRRLRDNSPDDILALAKFLAELATLGHLKINVHSSIKKLREKGYLAALKKLGPELQKELSKYAFLFLSQVSQAFETIKTILKK